MPLREASAYLILDGSLEPADLEKLVAVEPLVELDWEHRAEPPTGARVLVCLGSDRLRELVPLALERGWALGLLPHPEAGQIELSLGVEGAPEKLVQHYAQAEAIEADLLTCNDQVVFSSVVIGDVLALRPQDASRPPGRWRDFFAALKLARSLRQNSYTLTTAKEQKLRLAAIGLLVLEHTGSSLVGRNFAEALNIADGRLTLLALAPRSILAYLWLLLRLLWPRKISLARLPASVGLIQTGSLLLEGPRTIDYQLDGVNLSAPSLELRILDQRLRLLPGPALTPEQPPTPAPDKDRVRVARLIQEESARKLAGAPLPLFGRAGEDDYRELFSTLRDNAALSSPYLVLMVLSVLLALTGLYANSAPVIIGAMILAPLMAPIVSLAMGLARTEPELIRNALRTLAAGMGIGLGCAIAVAWLLPLQNLTGEMQSRLSPSLLDLSVAVLSGAAGAYAHSKEQVAKSLAGVAIAVALVPPLSVAGIGIGWADWAMARGALLLFITNLVGITLAAGATFLVLGFAPFGLARKGIAVSLGLLALIIGPLYFAFADLVTQGRIVQQIPTGRIELAGRPVDLRLLEVRTGDPPLVGVVLSSARRLDESHVDALKDLIGQRIGRPVVLEAQLNLRR